MKVFELIKRLQDEDPEAEVHFTYDYGDHWRTKVAPKVRSVKEAEVVHSDYHSMPKIVRSIDSDDDDNEQHKDADLVVVLSSSI